MTTDEFWTKQQLREFLQLAEKKKTKTWYRVRPLFQPALTLHVPGLQLYNAAKVRQLLDGRFVRSSPMARSRHLRKVG